MIGKYIDKLEQTKTGRFIIVSILVLLFGLLIYYSSDIAIYIGLTEYSKINKFEMFFLLPLTIIFGLIAIIILILMLYFFIIEPIYKYIKHG